MINPVYISSASFKTRSTRELVNLALNNDLTHIELAGNLDYSDDMLNPIRASKERIKFLVHNYFPTPKHEFVLNLASKDPEIRRMSMELAENAIRLCVVLGSPFYSIKGGTVLDISMSDFNQPERQAELAAQQPINYEEAYRIFLDSIGTLNDYAKQWGVKLLIQNNLISPTHLRTGIKNQFLMVKADEFERLKNDISDDNLAFSIDLAHLEISSNALYFNKLYFLERLRSYIECLHLSDNDGQRDTNEPISPVSWFIPILKTFTSIPMVVDAYNLNPDQIVQQRDWVIRFRKPGTGALVSRDE
jgi:sugar phosphate isomerase/epimerase